MYMLIMSLGWVDISIYLWDGDAGVHDVAWKEVSRILVEDGRLLDLSFMRQVMHHPPHQVSPATINALPGSELV
jgi:hypothetical protein